MKTMDTMETVRVLAQDYAETLNSIEAKRRKYGMSKGLFYWLDTHEVASVQEVNGEVDRYNAEVKQSLKAFRDKAYAELGVENQYRVSKRVFDTLFVNSRSYAESECGLDVMDDCVEYWGEVFSYCLGMCELIHQAIEDAQ